MMNKPSLKARTPIAQDVKQFIERYINSVVCLEVLLLLHRKPQRCWSNCEIAKELGIDALLADAQLEQLHKQSLIRKNEEGRFHYDAANTANAVIDGLAAACARQRVAVFSLILTKNGERVRGFAEAFRLIREED